jgi:hypothetical protein
MRLVLDLLVLRNLLLELLVGVVDEAVDRLEEAVHLNLLVHSSRSGRAYRRAMIRLLTGSTSHRGSLRFGASAALT